MPPASKGAPRISQLWLPLARTPASTVLHGCEALPIVDWPRLSCGSAPSLPSTQKANISGWPSSNAVGIPVGAMRSPFPI
jgi:hypothetical protein